MSILERVGEKLISIGIAMSATKRLEDLLDLIVSEACEIALCDGASIYLNENDTLRFMACCCESLERRMVAHGGSACSVLPKGEIILPLSGASIAGYVGLTKQTLLTDDVQHLPADAPYRHDHDFDRLHDYQTRSLLTAPIVDVERNLLGVLQLVNHNAGTTQPGPFPRVLVPTMEAIASQAAVAIKNAQLMEALQEVQFEVISRLSNAAEFRDDETTNHVERVSRYSVLIARRLGLSSEERERIKHATPLHDIGKVGIPDDIILKPGALSEEEHRIMRTHSEIGGEIFSNSKSALLQACEQVARYHHERWDGSGYPEGLSGEAIPLFGRIVAVTDMFDAACSKRVYRPAHPFERVVEMVREGAGSRLDPRCVSAFLDSLEEVRKIYLELQDS